MAPDLPRPVTPIAIAAALLASVSSRSDSLPDDVRADLDLAREIVTGLDSYVARCTSPASSELASLEDRTRTEVWDGGLEQEMLSGHVEGAFLRMLVAATGARHVLEVGMFTGYSALAMAEALPDDGRVVACEVDEHAARVAREAFAGSAAGGRVDVRLGPALETLHRLAGAGERFDLVFVDADKPGYADYVDAILEHDLLSQRGLLCVDNTLMQGQPWAVEEHTRTANGEVIATFNQRLADDPRVEQVLVPLRDGLTLVRRVA